MTQNDSRRHPAARTDGKVLGLDIGGANIKLSDGASFHWHEPFALWQMHESLDKKLGELLTKAPEVEQIAITMTGELSDCFPNKQQGVHFIVDAMTHATDRPVSVYLLDGRFVDPETAKTEFALAAASNWHAIAGYVALHSAALLRNDFDTCLHSTNQDEIQTSNGMLIDIGSTTTDLIPFTDGRVVAQGHDDYTRMLHHELVYTGVVRSNVAGIVSHVDHRGDRCPVMNEMFAMALDTNIILGHIAEGSETHYASDGMPTTMGDCRRRMARMIGKDEQTFNANDAVEMAQQVYQEQFASIFNSASHVLQNQSARKFNIVVSGQGEFMAIEVADRLKQHFDIANVTRFSTLIDEAASSCAAAFCLARLAATK